MPTFPGLVSTNSVISSSYMNSLRNAAVATYGEIYQWTQDVAAVGHNLFGVGSLTAENITATGAMQATSLSLTGALSVPSLSVSGQIGAGSVVGGALIGSTGNFSGQVVVGGDIVMTGNLNIGNSGGDVKNVHRVDGFTNTLFLVADSGPGATVGTKIAFRTTTAGVTAATDRMIIDEQGRVGINTGGSGLIANLTLVGQQNINTTGGNTFDCSLTMSNLNATAAVLGGILRVVSVNDSATNALCVMGGGSGWGLQVYSNGNIINSGPAGMEHHMSSTGSLNMGLRMTDATRAWKTGINIGSVGPGRYTIYNLTANAPLLSMGDIDFTVHPGFVRFASPLPGPYATNSDAIAAGMMQGRLYRDASNNVKQVQ